MLYAKVFPVDFEHVIVGFSCMVCETQNLLTLQYAVYSEIPFRGKFYHTESGHLQCNANQLNGFNRRSGFNARRVGLFFRLIGGWGFIGLVNKLDLTN